MKTTLIVSSGQYETYARRVVVTHTTIRGLIRRIYQLSEKHSVYGDNWAGQINAHIAIASKKDIWYDNRNGVQGCEPGNDWFDLSPSNWYLLDQVKAQVQAALLSA